MKLGAFDLNEPVPEFNEPHAFAVIQPWTDVSSAGSLTLSCLEATLGSKKLARLAEPGNFFDFTRYRPIINRTANSSEIEVPNTVITYGKQPGGYDFLFLRLLEPHVHAEAYIDSVVELFQNFGVKRYCLIGSMYDMVPYTRPLLVTGTGSGLLLKNELAAANVIHSNYSGPTTILSLIGQRALQLGLETCNLIVHLPNYLVMEEDYRGEKRLMEVISSIYDFTMPPEDIEKANQQEREVRLASEQIIQQEPRLGLVLKQLEDSYDSRTKQGKPETRLSPEVEKFLQDLDKRFRQE